MARAVALADLLVLPSWEEKKKKGRRLAAEFQEKGKLLVLGEDMLMLVFGGEEKEGIGVGWRRLISSFDPFFFLLFFRFFIPKSIFQLFEKDGLHGCSLTLPPNAAFQKIVGPRTCSSNLAKQLVGLDACKKKLHELGALSDRLLPFYKDSQETKFAGSNESTTGHSRNSTDYFHCVFEGTTKRKELHGMERVRALHGTWAHEPDGITLNAYRIHFVCDQGKDSYSDFVMLLDSSLDDDIASEEIKLYLTPNKIVTSVISSCGKIDLIAEEIEKSKLFQEFFFNGMFGRLFTGSKGSGLKREFLFGEQKMPWSSSKMYLLLPLEPSSGVTDTGRRIDWMVINESISVVEYLKKIYSVDDEPGNATTCSPVACETCVNSQFIKLANNALPVRCLKDSVVFSIHDGRIYSVLDVINDVSSDDPFDQIHAPKLTQPLLLLKQSHNPDNLLSRSRFKGDSSGEKTAEKEQVHARMPPELLVHINVSTDILKSFYLLPSIMHRLESLMLACQLRDEIAFHQIQIPISLILEAITTERCCESFSLERLEPLGYSLLKYALSCYLFLKYPTKHEGNLTACRSQAIRNSTLHRLGTSRCLQGYIRDNAFDPLLWLAPGQISIHPLPCVCGVDTYNVPIERKYTTEEVSVVVGVPCDRGHRWMRSKTIADCVEALVGAYYAGGGLSAALSLIKWLGIDITIDKVLVKEAKISASHSIHHLKVNKIELLESELNYIFSSKGLLLEAITHPSYQELGLDFSSKNELGLGYSYQRLEFLGDSVLDLLITRHYFLSHKDVGPGVFSNENFAQIATRNNFDKYLQHGSRILSEKIKEYVTAIANHQCGKDKQMPNGLPKAPKVLADIFESIAGAILIDTNFNLHAVRKIFEPLLSPIITTSQVALCLLKQLKAEDISHDQCTPKRDKEPSISTTTDSLQLTANSRSSGHCCPLKGNSHPKTNCKSTKAKLDSPDLPITVPIRTEKGGPRTALFNLCKIHRCPKPHFKLKEEKFRTPIILNGVQTPNFNLFRAIVTLHIPNSKVITVQGEEKTNKKTAQDSAAREVLLELEKQEICILKEL
ncbi:endoribonuclease Dicer homolog 3b-like [Zingiber officinale]|uniref:endoribonuclease Dicer homolog 3b-like n=1 Tax=Zingiber officinale TaxID=94328 RepID=UPI001C4D79CB|nr:endoribonuclease Dicer homolog 3b-like [Zingiber officinale]